MKEFLLLWDANGAKAKKGIHAMMNATLRGKPDAGNPHVRFDEGEVAPAKPRRGALLCRTKLFTAMALSMGILSGLAESVHEPPQILGFTIGESIDVSSLPVTMRKTGLLRRSASISVSTNQWINFKLSVAVGIFDEVRLHYTKANETNVLDRIVLTHQYAPHVCGEDIQTQLKNVIDSVKRQYHLIGDSTMSAWDFADTTSWVGYKDGLIVYADASLFKSRWSLTLRFEYDPEAIRQTPTPFDAKVLSIPNPTIRNDFDVACKSNRIESLRVVKLYEQTLKTLKDQEERHDAKNEKSIKTGKSSEEQQLQLQEIQEELKRLERK